MIEKHWQRIFRVVWNVDYPLVFLWSVIRKFSFSMNQQVALVIENIFSFYTILNFLTDPYNRRLIWTIIRQMKQANKCLILTTHFLEEADMLSDRIAIMTHGHLQAQGKPEFLKQKISIYQIEISLPFDSSFFFRLSRLWISFICWYNRSTYSSTNDWFHSWISSTNYSRTSITNSIDIHYQTWRFTTYQWISLCIRRFFTNEWN